MLFMERKSNWKTIPVKTQEEEINAKEEGRNFFGLTWTSISIKRPCSTQHEKESSTILYCPTLLSTPLVNHA